MSDGSLGRSPFPPIASYGFLSDCETTTLIAPSGNVEWLCLPRPDSPSVFGSMLDRSAGGFRLSPTDVTVPAGRRYLPGTLVIETTWQLPTGWLITRDALCVRPWYHDDHRSHTYRRSPTDFEAEHILLRTVRCVSGTAELNLDCDPVFDYGRRSGRWEYQGEGYGDAVVSVDGEDPTLRLTTNMRLGFEGRSAHARTRMSEGDNVFVALSWGEQEPPTTWDDAYDRSWRTAEFWRQWLNHGEFPDHPWRIYLQRSALTLKGLGYAPTGALLAAATRAGADNVNGPNFTIADPSSAAVAATEAALTDARRRADAAANALGMRVSGVRSVGLDPAVAPTEPVAGSTPEADSDEGRSPPVEPGQAEVRVTAVVVFELDS